MLVYIYKLVDPRDLAGIPQYVGKTRNAIQRLNAHIWKPHSSILQRWISQLKEIGLRPKMIVLCVVSDESWSDAEKIEVEKARALNPALLNLADGGIANGPPHDIAVRLGKRMARIAQERHPEFYREHGRWLGLTYSSTKEGRIRASVRGKKNIVKSHATMRKTYFGTPINLLNTSRAGRKGIVVAMRNIRAVYWKTEKCLLDRIVAGRKRAAATNHKRWHLDRGRVVESCSFCVGA